MADERWTYSAINTCAKLNEGNEFMNLNAFYGSVVFNRSGATVGVSSDVQIWQGNSYSSGNPVESVAMNIHENADNSSDLVFYRKAIENGQRVWRATPLSDIAKRSANNIFSGVNTNLQWTIWNTGRPTIPSADYGSTPVHMINNQNAVVGDLTWNVLTNGSSRPLLGYRMSSGDERWQDLIIPPGSQELEFVVGSNVYDGTYFTNSVYAPGLIYATLTITNASVIGVHQISISNITIEKKGYYIYLRISDAETDIAGKSVNMFFNISY